MIYCCGKILVCNDTMIVSVKAALHALTPTATPLSHIPQAHYYHLARHL